MLQCLASQFGLHVGEVSALLSMIMESWTKDLRQIQSAAIFHRLELERVISSMQTQVHVVCLILPDTLCVRPQRGFSCADRVADAGVEA